MSQACCARCGSTTAPRGVGQGYCMACIAAWQREAGDRTRAVADHHNEPWSALEDEIIWQGVEEGMCLEDIAILVGRTYHAVSGRLTKLRHTPDISYRTTTTTVTTFTTTTRHEQICPVCHITLPCYC